MSDFAALTDPNHVCGNGCRPHLPLASRDLESLEESAHIDALYDELNLVREHATLMLLALSRASDEVRIPVRSVAVLLDLDEEKAFEALGPDQPYRAADVVSYAIQTTGEDGYVGRAMSAVFAAQLQMIEDLLGGSDL